MAKSVLVSLRAGPAGSPPDLPGRIDHTLLRPDTTREEILQLCAEARRYDFGVIFVPPCYLEDAAAALAGGPIRIGVPIGFPLGNQTTRTKVEEAQEAAQRGALELDMVINIGRLKSGDHALVYTDIAMVDIDGDLVLDFEFLDDGVSGEPILREPDKVESWNWYSLDTLPRPLFLQ